MKPDLPDTPGETSPKYTLPRVAVIIPILNEGKTLGPTLQSLAAQDYPPECLEVLIVDGGSTDNWTPLLENLDRHNITHRTLANPNRSTAAAVNLALRSTGAPYVVWLSGHCQLSPDYIRLAIDAITAHNNIIVGGRLTVRGEGVIGRLNALVLGSRFGAGIAPWKRRGQTGSTESATYAVFDRKDFLDAGGVNERLLRNQDNELTARMHRRGIRYFLTTATAAYIAPATLMGLWKRAWKNGSWVVWSTKLGMPAYSWYHLAPSAAILIALVLAALSFASSGALYTLGALAAVYLLLSVGFAVLESARHHALWAIPILPVLFFLLHTVHGSAVLLALPRPVPAPANSTEKRADEQYPS